MTIKVGDKIPSVTLNVMTEDGPDAVSYMYPSRCVTVRCFARCWVEVIMSWLVAA